MKFKFKQDLVASIIFLVVSIVIWFMIPSQIKVTGDELITSQTFPRVIIGLMGACSLYLFIVQIVKMIKKTPVKEVEIDLKKEGKSLLVIGMLIGFWVLLHFLTFMASSVIFGIAMLLFFRCRNWKYYLIVTATIVTITLVFQNALGVSLP